MDFLVLDVTNLLIIFKIEFRRHYNDCKNNRLTVRNLPLGASYRNEVCDAISTIHDAAADLTRRALSPLKDALAAL